jgi:hypothetical protein
MTPRLLGLALLGLATLCTSAFAAPTKADIERLLGTDRPRRVQVSLVTTVDKTGAPLSLFNSTVETPQNFTITDTSIVVTSTKSFRFVVPFDKLVSVLFSPDQALTLYVGP